MMPTRIQRKRTKGWQMPANTVYVGRPTGWGNPFSVKDFSSFWAVELYDRMITSDIGEAAWAVYKYAEKVTGDPNGLSQYHRTEFIKKHLRGKNLACWCALDKPCHADILLEIANEPEVEDEF